MTFRMNNWVMTLRNCRLRVLLVLWLVGLTQLPPHVVSRFVSEDAWKLHFNNSQHPVVPYFLQHLPKFELTLEVNCTNTLHLTSLHKENGQGNCPQGTPKGQNFTIVTPGQKVSFKQVHIMIQVKLGWNLRHLINMDIFAAPRTTQGHISKLEEHFIHTYDAGHTSLAEQDFAWWQGSASECC